MNDKIIKMIKDEIKWSEDHSGCLEKAYEEGFVRGLKQALHMIETVSKED